MHVRDGRFSRSSALTTISTDLCFPFPLELDCRKHLENNYPSFVGTQPRPALGTRLWYEGETPPCRYFRIRFESTDANIETAETILVCKNGWLTVVLIAILAPLLAGVVSVLVRPPPSVARSEHIYDITTMIRDKPFVVIPARGSSLDDNERSRLLQDVPWATGRCRTSGENGSQCTGNDFWWERG